MDPIATQEPAEYPAKRTERRGVPLGNSRPISSQLQICLTSSSSLFIVTEDQPRQYEPPTPRKLKRTATNPRSTNVLWRCRTMGKFISPPSQEWGCITTAHKP